jgi:hypothetical protein
MKLLVLAADWRAFEAEGERERPTSCPVLRSLTQDPRVRWAEGVELDGRSDTDHLEIGQLPSTIPNCTLLIGSSAASWYFPVDLNQAIDIGRILCTLEKPTFENPINLENHEGPDSSHIIEYPDTIATTGVFILNMQSKTSVFFIALQRISYISKEKRAEYSKSTSMCVVRVEGRHIC